MRSIGVTGMAPSPRFFPFMGKVLATTLPRSLLPPLTRQAPTGDDMLSGMRILFVCLGNICRSPLAEGIFRKHVEAAGLGDRFDIDSAGTGDWHIGEAPDKRAQATAHSKGLDISGLRGRQFSVEDFSRFDRIVVMDSANHRDVSKLAANDEQAGRVEFLLDYAEDSDGIDVPDPYFGGDDGFEHVYALIDGACQNLLTSLRRELPE